MMILLGRSGTGKTTVRNYLIKLGFYPVITYTTRPLRKNEIDGVDYNFINKENFIKKEQEGFFVETTKYRISVGEEWYYGTAKEDLKDDRVLILNPEGFKTFKKNKDINFISFYITTTSENQKIRLSKRGDDPGEIIRRLEADEEDFIGLENEVDYIVENNNKEDLKKAIEFICSKASAKE